ncbi:DUF2470 domain-containing protein [Geodermatophilus sp. SYSU D00691]
MPLPRSTEPTVHEATAAERARTIACRGTAYVHVPGMGSSRLLAAATTADGDVLLVVPRDGGLVTAVRSSPLGDLPVRVTVTDRAPLPLRNPVRGRLEMVGWLTPVAADEELDLALAFAESCPDDVLLDVGLTATLLRLDVAEIQLEEAGSSADVEPEDYAAARPDPLDADELLRDHADDLGVLCGKVRLWAGTDDRVHVLAVDRFGVLFRVECPASCYDVRMPFPAPAGGRDDVGPALTALLACGG